MSLDGPVGLIEMVHLNSDFCSSLNSADLIFGLVTIDPFEFMGHLCKWIKTLCDRSNYLNILVPDLLHNPQ